MLRLNGRDVAILFLALLLVQCWVRLIPSYHLPVASSTRSAGSDNCNARSSHPSTRQLWRRRYSQWMSTLRAKQSVAQGDNETSPRKKRSGDEGTIATPVQQSIAPAVFEEDLYAVLGVSRYASKGELKAAFQSLATQHHPDRNNSEVSLAIFRNVTHAYSILGRSEEKRRQYDTKLGAQDTIRVVSEVSEGVLKPLAFGVALPLLNYTIQSIGGFAKPILQDAIEQSNAGLKAALEAQSFEGVAWKELNMSALDPISRASYAVRLKALDQTIDRLQINIDSSDAARSNTELQLRDSLKDEQQLSEKYAVALNEEKAVSHELQLHRMEKARSKLRYDEAEASRMQAKINYETDTKALLPLQEQMQNITAASIAVNKEIADLERRLRLALQTKAELEEEKSALSDNLKARSQQNAAKLSMTKCAQQHWEMSKLEYRNMSDIFDATAASYKEAQLQRETIENAIEQQKTMQQQLKKRSESAASKTYALQRKLRQIKTRREIQLRQLRRALSQQAEENA